MNRGKNLAREIACMLLTIVALAAAVPGQSQIPTAKQLTDAEAQALMQRVTSAPAASKPLTAAETRALVQYVTKQSEQQGASAAQEAQAKAQKNKIVRIGLVMPNADLGTGYQGDSVAGPLRAMLTQYLSGPVTELVNIDSLVQQQVDAEARQKQCDYVLYAAVSQKKGGGGGIGLFKGATTIGSMMPGVGAARAAGGALSAAGSVASAASAAQEAASVSKGVKGRSELSFEYKLVTPTNSVVVLSDTLKTKADTDGQDVMTPLVQQVAQAVMTQVTKP